MPVWGYGVEKEEMDKKKKRRNPSRLHKQNLNHAPPPRTPNHHQISSFSNASSKMLLLFRDVYLIWPPSSCLSAPGSPSIGLDAGHGCHLDSFPCKRQQHRSCEADFLRVPAGIFCLPKIRRTIIEMRQPVQQLSIRV